jgi:hypothetical protein
MLRPLQAVPRGHESLRIFSETDWAAKFLALAPFSDRDSLLLQSTRRHVVPESDARVALRGQDSLVAAVHIMPGTLFPVNCPLAWEDEYYEPLKTEAEVEESDRYAFEFVSGTPDEGGKPLIADLYRGCETAIDVVASLACLLPLHRGKISLGGVLA